jgi:hypothetical protein
MKLDTEKESSLSVVNCCRRCVDVICLLLIIVHRITPYVRYSLLSALKVGSFNNEGNKHRWYRDRGRLFWGLS